MASARRTRFKTAAAVAGLGLGCVVLLLAGLEAFLRTTHAFNATISWSKPDSLLGFHFAPGSRYWFKRENDHVITGRINRFGWRDRDWQLHKQTGVFRVAVLGDSYIEALHVESDSTFLRLTEARLRGAVGTAVETMNFGRSGFSQTEELLVLQHEVLGFQPDMVIACFLPGNDVVDVRRDTASNRERPFFTLSPNGRLILDASFRDSRSYTLKRRIDPIKRRSALVSLVTERYNLLQVARRAPGARVEVPDPGAAITALPPTLTLCSAQPQPKMLEAYALNKRLIAEMATVCRASGIRFMLLCLNSPGFGERGETEFKAIDPSFDAFFFEKDLEAYANSLGILYLGLQTPFRLASATGQALHWIHWNYAGHRVAAQALSDALAPLLASQRDE